MVHNQRRGTIQMPEPIVGRRERHECKQIWERRTKSSMHTGSNKI